MAKTRPGLCDKERFVSGGGDETIDKNVTAIRFVVTTEWFSRVGRHLISGHGVSRSHLYDVLCKWAPAPDARIFSDAKFEVQSSDQGEGQTV